MIEEMRKDDLESGYTYTKEITAIVEDLELAPKRRSVTSFPLKVSVNFPPIADKPLSERQLGLGES